MLSIALIVKNEEKNLARCLDSINGLWDELVIVDTGSTDKTVEIAKKYTSTVYFFEWIKDFAAARNFSFSKCTQPWVMWLDADDILHPEDVKIIKDELPKIPQSVNYVLMNYHYFLDSTGKPLATQLRERIIRQGIGKWAGRCHEIIPVWFEQSKSIDAAVWHCRDLQDMIADRSRNIELMKLEVAERPSDRNYYYLAQECADHGLHHEAIEAYKKALEKTTIVDTQFQACFKIARSYTYVGDDSSAIEWHMKSLQYHTGYREPLIDLAQIYLRKKDHRKAVLWAETALKVEQPKHPIMIIEKQYYSWLPYDVLSRAYFALGEFDKAIKASEELYVLTKQAHILNDIQVSKNAKKSTYRVPPQPVKLNLGSGSKTIEGFINCDLFPAKGVDEIFSMDDIPYADETVEEISSEHALEHLPRLRGEAAIKEWARVLRPGGKLELKIPDLEISCQKFLSDPANRENWWLYVLYGIQDHRHTEHPFKDHVNYGQIHYTGFTKESIQKLLIKAGFVIEDIHNYDGYDTPSISITARKVSSLNLAVYLPYNYDVANPSVRLRRLFLQEVLKKHGIRAEIETSFERTKNYDNILFSHYGPEAINQIQTLKSLGKRIFYDHSEALFGYPYQKETFELCDVIVCCSSKLAELTHIHYPSVCTAVVHDMFEEVIV